MAGLAPTWHSWPMENTDQPPGPGVQRGGDDAGILLDQIASGDRQAFADLYELTGGMLLAVIIRVVRDRDLAEEVLHECFTYIWTSARSFDGERGTGTGWLVTLARRRAIDCVRSTQSQRTRETVQGIREINLTAGFHGGVDDEVETRIESARAATALRTLPPEQGRVIALVYYEGLTHQQAAERTGIPLGTVKTRIRDGLKRLREQMEGVR